MDNKNVVYKRVLLKLSGEALSGDNGNILNGIFLEKVSAEIKKCVDMGVQFAIVIGAGNIWRGSRQNGLNIDRVRGDHMGMLATVINSLAMQDYLIKAGLKTRIMSAFEIQQVCEPYSQYKAIDALESGEAVIIPCGVGYPFFSTDTGMVLRAAELNCDIVLSAKNVDGVYDKDPNEYPDAKKYDSVTFDQVLKQNIKAIDVAASAMGKENNLKIIVFALENPQNITKAIMGENIGTILSN
ncbi:MAG: UMP kinase [Clostridiales bacterium GWF2_36_10]|nr:MAG: UMP kinase [Clostridiales bacterium GWF2_36_10]HAN21311.1 UMP kinase [Clostridiales bacterium]